MSKITVSQEETFYCPLLETTVEIKSSGSSSSILSESSLSEGKEDPGVPCPWFPVSS